MPRKKKLDVEGSPVVPVVFRRSLSGYPRAGSFGYLDKGLVDKFLEKGHVVLAIDEVSKPDKKESVVSTDDEGIITIETGDEPLKNVEIKIEGKDAVDSSWEPRTDKPRGEGSVSEQSGARYRRSDPFDSSY